MGVTVVCCDVCQQFLGDNTHTHNMAALHLLLLYTGGDHTEVSQDGQKVTVLELY